jgi:hypothetical protein
MRVRQLVSHRQRIGGFLGYWAKSLVRNLDSPFVRQIDSSLTAAFVVGCGHSGTTLLAAKIGLLQGCYVPGWETGLFLPINGLHAGRQGLDFLLRMTSHCGASVLVEKTPKHVFCAARIRRVFPSAKFLVTTRNPLDSCASLYRRFGNLEFAVERWNMDNQAALDILSSENSMRVAYEDLVSMPSQQLSEVAQFLGLPFDDKILDASTTVFTQEAADPIMAIRAKQVAGPIAPRVGTWRDELSSSQVDFVMAETESIASRLGFQQSL